MPQTALKYDIEVMEEGRVELHVPFPPGARVTGSYVKMCVKGQARRERAASRCV